MSWWEILIIVAAAGFVVAVVGFSIRRKMQGKNSCGDSGGCCSSCSSCRYAKKPEEHTSEDKKDQTIIRFP